MKMRSKMKIRSKLKINFSSRMQRVTLVLADICETQDLAPQPLRPPHLSSLVPCSSYCILNTVL